MFGYYNIDLVYHLLRTVHSEPNILVLRSTIHLVPARMCPTWPHNRSTSRTCHFDAISSKRRAKDRAQVVVNLVSVDVIGEHLLWLPVVEAIWSFGDFDSDTSRFRIASKRF
jgi:hypothetical protein